MAVSVMKQWEVIEGLDDNSAIAHPLNDVIEHDVDGQDACACGPLVEPVQRRDGSIGWVYTHHAVDGRV